MARPDPTAPFWLVGCGNMAGAMVEGWRRAGTDLSSAIAIRPSGKPVEGVRTVTALPSGDAPGLCMLGVKPQKLDEVVPELATRLAPDTIVVSMLAGVELASLRARLPTVRAIVRIMPNLPVSEGRGVIPMFGDGDDEARRLVEQWMQPLGFAFWCGAEDGIGAVGAVAGSGPAYVARFADALARAGAWRGIEPELSLRIALETLLGTVLLAQRTGESMVEIARRVTSPNGTTQAGLAMLDADGGLEARLRETVAAATRRGEELAAAARRD